MVLMHCITYLKKFWIMILSYCIIYFIMFWINTIQGDVSDSQLTAEGGHFGIYVQQSTILDLGIKEYLRIFYSSFLVKRIFILLIYLSRDRKKLERGFLMYYFFL